MAAHDSTWSPPLKFKRMILPALAFAFTFFQISSAFASAPLVEKEWTFITFLNGHNNLDRNGHENISEMEKVGSSDDVNVVVQWASYKFKKTKRIYVRNGAYDTIEELDRVDMGDVQNLVSFVNWAIEKYPARHYFINVWDHGTGWHFTKNAGERHLLSSHRVSPYDISIDDVTGHAITTEELGQALEQISQKLGRKIDIYGSDACLMAMAEIMNEMNNSVEVFIGSEETEPDKGWPYGDVLRRWTTLPSASREDVAKIVVEEYFKAYSGGVYGRDDVTLSAVDLAKFDSFQADFKNFASNLRQLSATQLRQIKKIARSTQSFASPDYKDFGDFLRRLGDKNLGLDSAEISTMSDSLSNFVIASQVTAQYKLAQGVSFWLPTDKSDWQNYQERYQNMKFDQGTGWSQFLALLFKN